MASQLELPNHKDLVYSGKSSPVSPFSFPNIPSTYSSGSSPTDATQSLKFSDGLGYHQRCSSESFLPEEQPSWLDELLNDSDTAIFRRSHHRRSASDTYAYLGDVAEKLATHEESNYNELRFGINSHHEMDFVDVESIAIGTKGLSLDSKTNEEVKELVKRNQETSSNEGSADKSGQVKPAASKTEAKRSKQHNAHRSRVRKLQYIAHLERTVQTLQAEGVEITAGIEFLEQQNMILAMENRALRQRLDSVTQEQLIKNWEQEMLKREIARLQAMYHQQKLQQNQPHQQHPKQHRRNKSKDHIDQTNNTSSTNSSRSSPNGSVIISNWIYYTIKHMFMKGTGIHLSMSSIHPHYYYYYATFIFVYLPSY